MIQFKLFNTEDYAFCLSHLDYIVKILFTKIKIWGFNKNSTLQEFNKWTKRLKCSFLTWSCFSNLSQVNTQQITASLDKVHPVIQTWTICAAAGYQCLFVQLGLGGKVENTCGITDHAFDFDNSNTKLIFDQFSNWNWNRDTPSNTTSYLWHVVG